MPAHQRPHDHQGHRGCNAHQGDQSRQSQSAGVKADAGSSPSLDQGSIYSTDPIKSPSCRTVSRSREVRADVAPAFSVSNPAASRRIASATRHFVWARDAGQCTYISPDGTRGESRYGLELDHRLPYAMGGDNSPGNLRLRCKNHNCLHAIESYGRGKISRHLQPR
jgi:5-methylcytosine-specific restriction endonuclease McrA